MKKTRTIKFLFVLKVTLFRSPQANKERTTSAPKHTSSTPKLTTGSAPKRAFHSYTKVPTTPIIN